jgi:N-methylhydantoinase B
MTNTLNTPTEVLEHTYPVRVRRYALRNGSGGSGKSSGGDGIVREIEMLTDVQVGILSDRRALPPYGLSGGDAGAVGKNEIVVVAGRTRALASKCTFYAPAGAIVRIETPGGGGWGLASGKVPRK